MPTWDDYVDYLGIQQDPLAETQEKFHVRGKKEYNKQNGRLMQEYRVYFRTTDLSVVYEYEWAINIYPSWNDYWTKYDNGTPKSGLIQYEGPALTDADFNLKDCSASSKSGPYRGFRHLIREKLQGKTY